jgi:hypothetical protein
VTLFSINTDSPPRMISPSMAKSKPFFGKQVIAIAVIGVPPIAHTSLMELSAAMRP